MTQEDRMYQEKLELLKKKDAERNFFWDERKKAGNESDPTGEEATKIATIHTELKALSEEVANLDNARAAAKAASDILQAASQPVNRPNFGNGNQQMMIKSVGQEIVEHPQFKAWVAKATDNGNAEISDSTSLKDFPQIDLKNLLLSQKGLVYTSNTSGGALVRRDYYPTVDLPLRPLTIRDAITIARTGSNLIEYVRVTSKTRAAAIVPEATATTSTGYSNAAKPEASMALEIVQAAVKTIAVWMPATRQILSDAPQLQSMIDNFLMTDLELALEEEVISGVGGASHFTGIENTTGVTPQAFTTDVLTTTRKARTAALITGRTASTGYLMNPYDWEALDLTKDAENRYYFGGPLSMGTKMLWGLPVFESEVIPQGTAYTGNLKTIIVWDRERPTTRVAEQHSDYFTHNMVAILTELRAAMGVLRPASLVKIDLLAGANS